MTITVMSGINFDGYKVDDGTFYHLQGMEKAIDKGEISLANVDELLLKEEEMCLLESLSEIDFFIV